jgi:hypothetical protein
MTARHHSIEHELEQLLKGTFVVNLICVSLFFPAGFNPTSTPKNVELAGYPLVACME